MPTNLGSVYEMDSDGDEWGDEFDDEEEEMILEEFMIEHSEQVPFPPPCVCLYCTIDVF